MTILAVSEIFGPTLQGEGPSAGQLACFMRLGGCNLHCSWCDSGYTWDASNYDLREEITTYQMDEVIPMLLAIGTDRLVITGGEPMLHQNPLVDLLREIGYAFPHVEMETNGTIMPDRILGLIERFNVSPKIDHSGNDKADAIKSKALRAYERAGNSIFKFVVSDPSDLIEVDRIVEDHGLTDVWLMPEGVSPQVLANRMDWICDAAIVRGWSVTSRLHIVAWGDERGR